MKGLMQNFHLDPLVNLYSNAAISNFANTGVPNPNVNAHVSITLVAYQGNKGDGPVSGSHPRAAVNAVW